MIKKMLSRIPNVILLLLLLGMSLSWGCGGGPPVLTITFTSSPQILNAGTVSGVMTIQIEDEKGTPYNVTADTVISLTSTSPTGRFLTSSSGNWYVTSVTIPNGSSSVNFFYKDNTAGSPKITAAESPSQGWTAATQLETVNSAALDHFSIAAIGNQIQNVAFKVTISAQDTFNNTVTSYTDSNTLIDSTGTISPINTGNFTAGIWTDNVTITLVQSGVTITTSGAGKSGVSNAFNIAVGAISKLVFTTSPQTMTAGNVSRIITLQTQDALSNPYNVIENTTINLTSSSSSGIFYSDDAGLNSITSVTITAGSNTASFYYKDTVAGSSTITAAELPSQGWTAATEVETVNAAALDHFSIDTINNQTANVAFGVNITARDIYNNTVTSYTNSNALSVSTGTINPTSTGAFTGGIWNGNITITSAQSGVIITTSGEGKVSVSNAFNVAAGAASTGTKLVFITAPQTIIAGNVSAIITLQTQDASNNPYNVTANTTVNLSSNSTNGKFYSDAAGLNAITTVIINAGNNSSSFYYMDTTEGSPTLTAMESPSKGWTAGTQFETVSAATLDHFSIATIGNQTQNVAFNITITAQDAYGNTVTTYTDSNTLSDTTGTINPTNTGAFTAGTWTDNITITSVQSGVTITTSGSDKSGTSNEFNIMAASAITKLAFTTAPQIVTAGNVSGIITIETQDASGKANNVTANITINLTSSSGNGKFFSDTAGLNPIAKVTINTGTSSASFYYKDTTEGSSTISASESPSQGWTAAIQYETINAAVAPPGTASEKGIPLFLVIGIGVGALILGGIIGFLVLSRIKPSAKGVKKETETKPELVSTEAEKATEKADTTKQVKVPEPTAKKVETPTAPSQPQVTQPPPKKVETPTAPSQAQVTQPPPKKVETPSAPRQAQVSQPPPKTAETPSTPRQPQVTQPPPKGVETPSTPGQAPKSELMQEIETNYQIATTPTEGNITLTAFQSKIWDARGNEISSLPANIKEELTKAYSIMTSANGIVWLATEMNRRSPNLEDNYAKLCKGIADQLDMVKKLMEKS